MAETLLSATTVLLYGRELEDLKLEPGHLPGNGEPPRDTAPGSPPRLGRNNFLRNQLGAHLGGPPERFPRFARIYCFGYEGAIYDLSRPQIFLVHGSGTLVEGPIPGKQTEQLRYWRAPGTLDR